MMKNAKLAWFAVVELINDLSKKLTKTYTMIFKGGVILVGLALAMLSTHIPQILDYELKAKETEFEFQVLTGQAISTVNCEQIKNHQKLCLLAKYQASTIKQSTGLFLMFYKFFLWAGCGLIGAAIWGFMLDVIFNEEHQTTVPPIDK
ncbi:hypothetical protein A5320_11595 [Rheinheimera sp. SA_1]|uniref:hypothetical protein n=1 Tax=Rheinheimera sp. SA_1 TaxID=1827365 RepID=UPI0007FC383D|nr:hypothetical protein [Rheinheimera sp. SA_1]OBP14413.1 hypothetical protein A5320_11595 [Rheinheimera sp. SA_1]